MSFLTRTPICKSRVYLCPPLLLCLGAPNRCQEKAWDLEIQLASNDLKYG